MPRRIHLDTLTKRQRQRRGRAKESTNGKNALSHLTRIERGQYKP